ncbi:MAG: ABC transporter substrate-binding protein [Bradyrhizobium sp.]|nr:ABC transporter substrate-binding protein [Bradyrhizobium sp.]
MRRRKFITALCGAATAWPLSLHAKNIPRVGILLNGRIILPRDLDFVRELARLGRIEGHNILYEIRAAEGNSNRLAKLARDLVATNPDVIVGSAAPAGAALFGATRTIPIVMTVIGDPIALGLTANIARPTHNVTGFTVSTSSLAAKRLELLQSMVPALRKVAYLWVPANPLTALFEPEVLKAANTLGIKLVSLPLASEADIASVFSRADEEQVMAVLVEGDAITLSFSASIVDECRVRNLPGIHTWPVEVRQGALASYGPATVENIPRAAFYVDRILKGAKVAELPFEEPTQVKLAINLRTARSIGFSFPPALLARADEVIE